MAYFVALHIEQGVLGTNTGAHHLQSIAQNSHAKLRCGSDIYAVRLGTA